MRISGIKKVDSRSTKPIVGLRFSIVHKDSDSKKNGIPCLNVLLPANKDDAKVYAKMIPVYTRDKESEFCRFYWAIVGKRVPSDRSAMNLCMDIATQVVSRGLFVKYHERESTMPGIPKRFRVWFNIEAVSGKLHPGAAAWPDNRKSGEDLFIKAASLLPDEASTADDEGEDLYPYVEEEDE